ncbi:MAG TPA: hypothetical protein GX701_05130 [Clostridiales bacterium]|jgi:hypothetical protein|nr:hypothetical protein [Clostridiales bacterium]
MKIVVREESGKKINIVLPTGMVLNRLTAWFACKAIRKHSDLKITRKQALRFIKELRRCKRRHRGWKLVEVESSDGDYVEIKL